MVMRKSELNVGQTLISVKFCGICTKNIFEFCFYYNFYYRNHQHIISDYSDVFNISKFL